MAVMNRKQFLRWEAYLRTHNRVRHRRQKFMYYKDFYEPRVYGEMLKVSPTDDEARYAVKLALEHRYRILKNRLRVQAGVELSPIEIKVGPPWDFVNKDPGDTSKYTCSYWVMSWRAVADKPISIEDQRRMELNKRRARRAML